MLSTGMYVSCPIIKKGIEVYVLGKIIKHDDYTKEVEVVFFDWKNINFNLKILSGNRKKYSEYDVKRSSPICSITAKWNVINVFIICEYGRNKKGLTTFLCKYKYKGKLSYRIIPESELDIDFYNIKNCATDEAYKFRNTDTKLFFVRQNLSERRARIDSFENSIFSLINTRIFLYPHQIDTVIKAINGNLTRVMLADEVGLGKTIEALTILKYYQQRNDIFRCIIVVPESLEYQWFNEVNERFGIDAEIFSYTKVKYKKTKATTFIISYGDYYRYKYDIEEMKWDMIIIDEAHKILNGPYYAVLRAAAIKTRNVILLSATPIVHDGIEYLRLMKMINPGQFKAINLEKFKVMMELQSKVAYTLVEINIDLEFYDDPDIKESFIANLEELNEDLNDHYLGQIIKAISKESDDNGLYALKLAMEYLRKQYVIDTNVIRHRREEVIESRIPRNLIKVFTYQMEGADVEVYEENVYNSILSLVNNKRGCINKTECVEIMEAMFSSPHALLPIFMNLDIWGDDKKECFTFINKWMNFCDAEIKRLIDGNAYHNTRFSCLINAIDTCEAEKILIFSSFKETVKVLYRLIQAVYGEESSVMFNSEMSRLQTQLAARKFQNDEKCRFIICDKSGGEGRNFQKADLIIHFDMPWSPAMMEQRIGRLDRIGRDIRREVDSIVIYSESVTESDIFNIYNNALNVFSRSLSGLEIIFDELQEIIVDAFVLNPDFGLGHANDEIQELARSMEENVEEEIYKSNSNENDKEEIKYIREVSDAFEGEKEKEVEDSIIYWIDKSGVRVTREKKTGLVTVDFLKASPAVLQVDMFYEAFNLDVFHGTFRREYAIEHDSVDYFSPNHHLYDIFMKQIDRKQRGRFLAVSMAEEIRWAGFVFVWNIEIDETQLPKGGMDPQKYHYLKKYLNEQQVTNTFQIYGTDTLTENDIVPMLRYKEKRPIYNIEDTIAYDIIYDEDSWDKCVNNALNDAAKRAKKTANSWLKIDELTNHLSKERIALEISKKTVCYPYPKRITIEKAIKEAILHCRPQIDSILYIEV